MTDPIVEFVPPSVTLDSVDVIHKDVNLIEITTRITVWTDDPEDQPVFNYNLGDTYFSHEGMEISCEPKQHVFVDILTLRVYDLYVKELHIEVADELYTIYLPDHIIIDKESAYPDIGVWVMF